jgi:hypothetical protein
MSGRRTFAQVRADARAERDIEIADWLDQWAGLVRARRSAACAVPIAQAAEGLASSIRAGLVE